MEVAEHLGAIFEFREVEITSSTPYSLKQPYLDIVETFIKIQIATVIVSIFQVNSHFVQRCQALRLPISVSKHPSKDKSGIRNPYRSHRHRCSIQQAEGIALIPR